MYPTFEADIIDGNIRSAENERLPARAHVLITLLSPLEQLNASKQGGGKPVRTPHPALKGSIAVLGDLDNTVPGSLWDLPR
jgi:hypothetical protein